MTVTVSASASLLTNSLKLAVRRSLQSFLRHE